MNKVYADRALIIGREEYDRIVYDLAAIGVYQTKQWKDDDCLVTNYYYRPRNNDYYIPNMNKVFLFGYQTFKDNKAVYFITEFGQYMLAVLGKKKVCSVHAIKMEENVDSDISW